MAVDSDAKEEVLVPVDIREDVEGDVAGVGEDADGKFGTGKAPASDGTDDASEFVVRGGSDVLGEMPPVPPATPA